MTESARGTAVVTGAGSGFGAGVAKRLGAVGYAVAALDIDLESAEATAAQIREGGGIAKAYRVDVRDQKAVDDAVEGAVADLGEVSALFNNAGLPGAREPWGEVREESVRLVLDVNLVGAINTLNACVRSMKRRGGGAVVNTASSTSFKGYGNARPAYIVSKHGIMGLTKEAAVQLAEHRIRVNGVAPGVARTPLMDRVHREINEADPDEVVRTFEAVIPDGRYATVDDVAAAVLFLLDESNHHISGTTISVDGAETAA